MLRVNLAHPTDEVSRKYGRPFMKQGIFSNTVRDGRMLDIVQEMLPGITCLCLNRDVTCAPHRDAKNTGEYSYVLFFGEFEGGELCLETGECFREHKVWHRFRGQSVTHWNLPHTGRKYSIVAYSRSSRVKADVCSK